MPQNRVLVGGIAWDSQTCPYLYLKDGGKFEAFSKKVRVYSKLYRFETVFESDHYFDVGADGSSKHLWMAK